MNRFNGSAPVTKVYRMDELDFYTWFERDRACVELRDAVNEQTVFEVWDEDYQQLVEDGFIDPRNLKQSVFEYAQYLGVIG